MAIDLNRMGSPKMEGERGGCLSARRGLKSPMKHCRSAEAISLKPHPHPTFLPSLTFSIYRLPKVEGGGGTIFFSCLMLMFDFLQTDDH